MNGRKLRQLRQEKGFSLRKLAELSGVSMSWISDIENNIGVPNVIIAQKLASALGVTVEDLLTEED